VTVGLLLVAAPTVSQNVSSGVAIANAIELSQAADTSPMRSTFYNGSSNAWMTYPNRSDFDATVSMTIEAWVYLQDNTTCSTIISHNRTNSFYLGYCNGLQFKRSGAFTAETQILIPQRAWTHVAVSYDGTNARFYKNGSLAGNIILNHGAINTNHPVYIGDDPNTANFNGNIDELRLWSVTRSAIQITDGMYTEIRSATGLIATFGSGGEVEDLTGFQATKGAGTSARIFGILPRDLFVPLASTIPPTVDGNIDPDLEYAGSEQLVIRTWGASDIPDAVAYMVHTANDLYIGIRPKALNDYHDDSISLYLDPTHARHTIAGPSDVRIMIPLNDSPPQWLAACRREHISLRQGHSAGRPISSFVRRIDDRTRLPIVCAEASSSIDPNAAAWVGLRTC